jgi:hypothetical protein
LAALGNGDASRIEPELAPNGAHKSGLERIATLLEEIDTRREVEARKTTR